MNYAIIKVLLSIISLTPIRNISDFELKWDIAEAIANATDEPVEQDTLVKIAWLESGFRKRVASCQVKGDRGKSLGIFQIQPISQYDFHDACGNVQEQVNIALKYLHRSYEACPGNVGADLLSMYVSGTCKRGIREAKNRWGGN